MTVVASRLLTRVAALIARQDVARRQLQRQSEIQLRAIFNRVSRDDWYQPKALQGNASQMARVSQAAQRQQANLTASYLTGVMREIRGEAGEPRAQFVPNSQRRRDPIMDRTPTVTLPDQPRGIDPLVEWERPAATFRWNSTLDDVDEQTASDRAWRRVVDLNDLDLQLADREATLQVLSLDETVLGYRRIIRPELSAGGTCGLCITASDRRYHVEELKAIHARCKCTVLPIYPEYDPGHSLNADDLKALYEAAGGTASEKLKRTRYKVEEHGELGPVLVQQGHQFTDTDQAAARVSVDRRLEGTQRRADDAQIFQEQQPAAAGGGTGNEPPPPSTRALGSADDDDSVLPVGRRVIAAVPAGSRSTGSPRSPEYLRNQGAVAPADDADRYFTPDETETANWLRSQGYEVLSVSEQGGSDGPRPDALLGNEDVTVDFKRVGSDNVATMRGLLRHGRHQTHRVVFDLRSAGVDEERAVSIMQELAAVHGKDFLELAIRFSADGVVSWRP